MKSNNTGRNKGEVKAAFNGNRPRHAVSAAKNGVDPVKLQEDSDQDKLQLAAIGLKLRMDKMVDIMMIHRKMTGRRNPQFNRGCAALDKVGRGIVAALSKYASGDDGKAVDAAIAKYTEYVADVAFNMPSRHLHVYYWITSAGAVSNAARKIQHELDLLLLVHAEQPGKGKALRTSFAKLIEDCWDNMGLAAGMDNYDPPQDVVLVHKEMSAVFVKSLKNGRSASESAQKAYKALEGAMSGMPCNVLVR